MEERQIPVFHNINNQPNIYQSIDSDMRRMQIEMASFHNHMQQQQNLLFHNLRTAIPPLQSPMSPAMSPMTQMSMSPTMPPPPPMMQVPVPFHVLAIPNPIPPQQFPQPQFPNLSQQSQSFQSSLIKDDGYGGKVLKLKFDVHQYSPEEVHLTINNNILKVNARHSDASGTMNFNYEFALPPGTKKDLISSHVTPDGFLSIEAPLPPSFIQNQDLITSQNQTMAVNNNKIEISEIKKPSLQQIFP